MKYNWENFKNIINNFFNFTKYIIKLLIEPHIQAFKYQDIKDLPIVIFDIITIIIILIIIFKPIKEE